MSKYKFTEVGLSRAWLFIINCEAKRKEILDAKLDTAEETILPTFNDILCDIEYSIDSDGKYYESWGVTDNYNSDTPLSLIIDKDFVKED